MAADSIHSLKIKQSKMTEALNNILQAVVVTLRESVEVALLVGVVLVDGSLRHGGYVIRGSARPPGIPCKRRACGHGCLTLPLVLGIFLQAEGRTSSQLCASTVLSPRRTESRLPNM